MLEKFKILCIGLGGTISMHKRYNGIVCTQGKSEEQNKFLFGVHNQLQIKALAELSYLQLADIDSTDMTVSLWQEVVNILEENYDDYDGFVVMTGTDTMAYLASALSFSIKDLSKPVILTGSQSPAEQAGTDALSNLENSIKLACLDVAGVLVLFGSKIMIGSRVNKISEYAREAFISFNATDFGSIGATGIEIHNDEDKYKCKNDIYPVFDNRFESDVVSLNIIPNMNADIIKVLLDSGKKGIVLSAFGTGNIPSNLLPVLKDAFDRSIPVIVNTQCHDGETVMGLYELGQNALEKTKVIEAFDMSLEASVVKLMSLLGQDIKFEHIKDAFHRNIAGEINITNAFARLEQKTGNNVRARKREK